jgi:hypothetical protein
MRVSQKTSARPPASAIRSATISSRSPWLHATKAWVTSESSECSSVCPDVSTLTGWRVSCSASVRISPSRVAEKSSVWRSFGQRATIFLTWG